jgi:RNA polymerase sigma-54 factor
MSVSLRLDLRQSQSLVMTPQLQQAIKLLQLNNLELSTHIQQELEQNPFLEQAEERPEPAAPEIEPQGPGDDGAGRLSGEPDFVTEDSTGDGWSGSTEDGWSDGERDPPPNGVAVDSLGYVGSGGRSDFASDDEGIENRTARPKTLREHLTEQMQVEIMPGPERLIAIHLIDLVDDAGYLQGELEDVALQLGCGPDAVGEVLKILQRLDPPGVLARSLKECLALQLADQNRLDPAMAALLDHLDLLAKADFAALQRVCGVLPDDLLEMISELKALNPKPGQGFAEEPVDAVVPDIFILPVTGGWRVELNTATLPRLIVNNAYHTEVRKVSTDQRAKEYVSERYQAANWLVKALDQRARTVLRVAEAVVERQGEFLTHGVTRLKPLVLRDIATAIEMHESTISRATAGRFLATPRGNFPFKYFFSNALSGGDGEGGHAAEAIRQQIKTLIDSEKPGQILSDDQIVDTLRAKVVTIARRTVAKYRDSLSIPSSIQRKRAKAIKLA